MGPQLAFPLLRTEVVHASCPMRLQGQCVSLPTLPTAVRASIALHRNSEAPLSIFRDNVAAHVAKLLLVQG